MIPRNVLLYGESLLLGLVAADLREHPHLQVAHVTIWEEASRLLVEQPPDVLIFDLTTTAQAYILPLLLTTPQLLLVGLDTEHSQGVVLSGQQADALTMAQIREIAETGGST